MHDHSDIDDVERIEPEADFGPCEQPLTVVFNDSDLIAVAKPGNLSVHRNSDDRTSDSYLLQRLRDQTGEWLYPIHRIDRATSGLIVFAKSSETAAKISAQFAERKVTKQYVALVRGFTKPEGEISHPLVSMRGRGKPDGHPARIAKHAETKFETIEQWELPFSSGRYPTSRCSLVNVFPQTGRWHQIRRHFNYDSHPIIGDSSHGDTRINKAYTQQLGLQCLMLSATFLKFEHPATLQQIHLECQPDSQFQDVIAKINALAEQP